MNRRTFLEASLGGLALTASPGLPTAADRIAGKPRVPLGFLGATYPHAPDKIKLAMTSPDWELVGVCESSAAGGQTAKSWARIS
jgi:hypothetical protein